MNGSQSDSGSLSTSIIDQAEAQAWVATARCSGQHHSPAQPKRSQKQRIEDMSSHLQDSEEVSESSNAHHRHAQFQQYPVHPLDENQQELHNQTSISGSPPSELFSHPEFEGKLISQTNNSSLTPPPVPSRAVKSAQDQYPSRFRQDLMNNSFEKDWQSNCATIRDRCARMFNNELMADVHFVVGVEKLRVPGHCYVLATGSSVFYAMLYGELSSKSRKEDIVIPDVEPVGLLNLFRFLYCDTADLNSENILATLYAAKKYIVPLLSEQCIEFLQQNLNAQNACLLLSQSRLFEEPALRQSCWVIIDAQASEAIASESFVDIDRDTLRMILDRQSLNCAEIDLFRAAVRWAVAECERRQLEPTAENQNMMLGDALYLIRVPAMKLEEFANHVARSGILSLKQVTDIFLHFTAATKPALPFPVKPRAGLTPIRCRRFHSTACRNNQWRYRGRTDSIRFQVDKRIFLGGVGLYGSSGNQTAEYGVRLDLKKDGAVLGSTVTRFRSEGSGNPHPVYLDHPVQIDTDTWYTISVVIDGSELSYFGQEGMTNVQVGHVNFQFHCSPDSNNGTGVQGGQIPELIFFA